MQRRKWDSKKKSEIVMRGFRGAVIADLCAEYGISQSQYYQWRDSNSWKAFEDNTRREEQLLKQNSKLKGLIGELTLELKKTTRTCCEAPATIFDSR